MGKIATVVNSSWSWLFLGAVWLFLGEPGAVLGCIIMSELKSRSNQRHD